MDRELAVAATRLSTGRLSDVLLALMTLTFRTWTGPIAPLGFDGPSCNGPTLTGRGWVPNCLVALLCTCLNLNPLLPGALKSEKAMGYFRVDCLDNFITSVQGVLM